MNDMELKALLREAGKERQELTQLHLDAIRVMARQRVRRRRVTGVTALLVLGVIILGSMWRAGDAGKEISPVANKHANTPAYLASTELLKDHIEEETRVRIDRRRATAALAAGEVVNLEEAREAAAHTMFVTASRRMELVGVQEAAAGYRRTISLFPETSGARQAREALGQLHLEN